MRNPEYITCKYLDAKSIDVMCQINREWAVSDTCKLSLGFWFILAHIVGTQLNVHEKHDTQ